MDLDFSAEDIAFREEARAFIAENYPAGAARQAGRAKRRSARRTISPGTASWPRRAGSRRPGRRNTAARAGPRPRSTSGRRSRPRPTPSPILPFGVTMLAPVIYTFGTRGAEGSASCRGIHDGDVWWCQGYSEPGAGSDLASLKTRAERITGDDGKEYYIVNGQKTWTTLAQFADWGFFLVRTDPDAKPQAGISFLLIDMKTPGITVRPIITLEGGHEVNDVFLDNVKVPVENRIFEENQGWTCAKFLLAHERSGIAGVARSKRGLERLRGMAAHRAGRRRRPAARRPVLQAQGRRAGDRPDGAGIHRAAHPGRRERRARGRGRNPRSSRSRAPRSSSASPNWRWRRPATTARPICAMLPHNLGAIGPDDAARRRRRLLQQPQDLDLRRLQRDPAQHHRQDGAGPLAPQHRQTPPRDSVTDPMDFSFTEEQIDAARHASPAIWPTTTTSTRAAAVDQVRGGLAAGGVEGLRRGARHPGRALLRGAGRPGRRRHREHGRHGGVRQGPGGRALSRHGGDRRRLPEARRLRPARPS